MRYALTLFFYCAGDHRDLHSFPTRRSSDLGGHRRAVEVEVAAGEDPLLAVEAAAGESEAEGNPAIGEHLVPAIAGFPDRKSTRLNSSHVEISYAVFCLKKKSTAYPLRR